MKFNNNGSHRVTPRGGKWALKRDGADRANGIFDTQKAAINAGRVVSKNQKTEFVVHGRNGQIRLKDSHSRDPYPPKG